MEGVSKPPGRGPLSPSSYHFYNQKLPGPHPPARRQRSPSYAREIRNFIWLDYHPLPAGRTLLAIRVLPFPSTPIRRAAVKHRGLEGGWRLHSQPLPKSLLPHPRTRDCCRTRFEESAVGKNKPVSGARITSLRLCGSYEMPLTTDYGRGAIQKKYAALNTRGGVGVVSVCLPIESPR